MKLIDRLLFNATHRVSFAAHALTHFFMALELYLQGSIFVFWFHYLTRDSQVHVMQGGLRLSLSMLLAVLLFFKVLFAATPEVTDRALIR